MVHRDLPESHSQKDISQKSNFPGKLFPGTALSQMDVSRPLGSP